MIYYINSPLTGNSMEIEEAYDEVRQFIFEKTNKIIDDNKKKLEFLDEQSMKYNNILINKKNEIAKIEENPSDYENPEFILKMRLEPQIEQIEATLKLIEDYKEQIVSANNKRKTGRKNKEEILYFDKNDNIHFQGTKQKLVNAFVLICYQNNDINTYTFSPVAKFIETRCYFKDKKLARTSVNTMISRSKEKINNDYNGNWYFDEKHGHKISTKELAERVLEKYKNLLIEEGIINR